MAYSKKQWCGDEFIKKTTVVDVNVDAKYIGIAIIEAQELYLRPSLGTALYNKINTDLGSLTGVYDTLFHDYILDVLKNYTLFLLAPNIVMKWRNTSIGINSGENFTPIDLNDIGKIQKQVLPKAETYLKRMNDYLIANSNDFPELYANTAFDQKNPNNQSFSTTMNLGPDDTEEECNSRFYS